jgi:excinuclease ABC subunit B
LDPVIDVQKTDNQIDHLIGAINEVIERGEKVLVTTLTKKMAESLTDFLRNTGIRVRYLHSEIQTLERMEILRDLRMNVFDVLVGINLLREGLDLPEVSLVAILDADKQGFLRTETSLVQTIGRAARHVNGRVIMYADRNSDAMQKAISETNRRRVIQEKFNREHNIEPTSVVKSIRSVIEATRVAEDQAEYADRSPLEMTAGELKDYIKALEKEMKEAAQNLEFERAALIRDRVFELKSHAATRGA